MRPRLLILLFRCRPSRALLGLAVRCRPSRALLGLAVALVALLGCQRDVGPQLIEVVDIAPREVERGDRVELIGASFPQGKKAHVTFRGALNRPGERPSTAEIATDATAATGTQIELDVTEALEELFCGAGRPLDPHHIHWRRRGRLPCRARGRPPVVATLHAVTLDVRPPTPRRALLDERMKEGENALAFFGIHPSKTPPASGGILVEAIDPGSRGEKAGLIVGDLLVELDRVRIDSVADVIPSGAAPIAKLAVRRGGSPTETKHDLQVAGFRANPPADLYAAALLLLVAAAAIVLFMAPSAGLLGWIERRVAARLQSRADPNPRASPRFFAWLPGASIPSAGVDRAALRADSPSARDQPLFRIAPYLVFAGASATFVVMPFGQYLIAADLDVGDPLCPRGHFPRHDRASLRRVGFEQQVLAPRRHRRGGADRELRGPRRDRGRLHRDDDGELAPAGDHPRARGMAVGVVPLQEPGHLRALLPLLHHRPRRRAAAPPFDLPEAETDRDVAAPARGGGSAGALRDAVPRSSSSPSGRTSSS